LYARALNDAVKAFDVTDDCILIDLGSKYQQFVKLMSKRFPGTKKALHMTKANEKDLAPFLMSEDKYIVCIRPRLGDYDNTYYESN